VFGCDICIGGSGAGRGLAAGRGAPARGLTAGLAARVLAGRGALCAGVEDGAEIIKTASAIGEKAYLRRVIVVSLLRWFR